MEWKDASKELPPIGEQDGFSYVVLVSTPDFISFPVTVGYYDYCQGCWNVLGIQGLCSARPVKWASIEGPGT